MKIALDNDGATCACWPGHRCRACRCRKDLTYRLIIRKWRDDVHPGHSSRNHLTHHQQTDARDRAWTARDAYSIFRDRDKYAHTWWELRWPDYWQRQAVVRDVIPTPTAADRAGWRAWMAEHQPDSLPDDGGLDGATELTLFEVTP